MAYNPFDFFRRNQKTAFAALTIFVMFTFVLSFGQGDFFQWIPGWLGSFRQRGKDVLATVDGRKLYDADLARYDDSRALADQFMKSVLDQVARNADENARENLKAASKPTQETIQKFLQLRQTNYVPAELIPMLRSGQFPQDALAQFVQRSKGQAQSSIRALTATPNQGAADLDAAKAAETLIQLDMLAERVTQGQTYFPIAQGKTNESRLEFDLWLRKADKLGIAIRPADAPAFVKEEFNNAVTPEVWNAVEKNFQTKQGYARSRLEAALADEYRVKTAFDIVFGRAQPTVTAYETFQFFKEKSDPTKYTILPVPAENFLDKVTATPTEAELRDLFDKYKNSEPDPVRETPGFRDPRKLKIAWAEVTGTEPFYKARGEEAFKLNDLHVGMRAIGFGPAGTLIAPFTLTLADPQLQTAYAGYRERFQSEMFDHWNPTRKEDDFVLGTSVARPQVVGASAATAVSSLLTRGTLFPAFAATHELAVQYERAARARGLAPLLAPGSVAGTGVLGSALASAATLPKPLPLDMVRTQLIDGVKKSVTLASATNDLQAFATELTRLGAKKDKSEARSYADKFLAERGLKTGGSADFRDQYSVGEDPGLAVLNEKKDRGHGMSDVPVPFGREFFQARGTAAPSFFEPQPYPFDPRGGGEIRVREFEPTYLTWRTDSQEPATPREFAAARPKVEAAWKRLKARELAKQAAEDLKKRIDDRLAAESAMGQKGKVEQIVSDVHTQFEREKYPGEPAKLLRSGFFLVSGVAPYRLERGSPTDVRGGGEQLVPFRMSNLTTKQLPNPSEKMALHLIEAKDKPLGTTLLEADRANDVYYVAVLKERDDSELPYFEAKGIVEGQSQVAGTMLQAASADAVRGAHDKVIALLKAEFRVANESEKLKEKPADGGQ